MPLVAEKKKFFCHTAKQYECLLLNQWKEKAYTHIQPNAALFPSLTPVVKVRCTFCQTTHVLSKTGNDSDSVVLVAC